MNIQLIQGVFSSGDAVSLITQMIQIKIKYHEGKINKDSHEEDIKAREEKIKRLQRELHELKNHMGAEIVQLKATIEIE